MDLTWIPKLSNVALLMSKRSFKETFRLHRSVTKTRATLSSCPNYKLLMRHKTQIGGSKTCLRTAES